MTDPALAHWLDEHRAHLCERIHHLVYLIQVLQDHDEDGLRAVLAERTAVATAAAQVFQHLQHSELVGTHLWMRYRWLAADCGHDWQELYGTHGAQVLRGTVLPDLEETIRGLAEPVVEAQSPADHHELFTWELYLAPARQLLALLHQLLEELAVLRHHPHDADHRAAAEPLLADATEQARALVHRLTALIEEDDNPHRITSTIKGIHRFYWARVAVGPLRSGADGLGTAALDHPDAVENAVLTTIAGLNNLLGR